jgi:hypothetical protein
MSQGIRVEFDNPEQTIIRWDFKGRWMWDDWHEGASRALELRQMVIDTPVVPAIFNFKYSGPVPMGALPHIRTAGELMDPRDYVVVANGSGFIRSLVDAFCTLNPSFRDKVMLADTLEEARALIANQAAE